MSNWNVETTLETNVQSALSDASQWLQSNRLVVNPNKSNFLIIGNPSKRDGTCFNLCSK